MKTFVKIQSISELHQMLGYAKPSHPLITVIDYSNIKVNLEHVDVNIVTGFYIISMKSPAPKSVQYGRQYYDFEEGTMMFIAPEQVFSIAVADDTTHYEGWGIYFHPDLINSTALGKKIKTYSFFSYSVSEALHLSDEEKNILFSIVQSIEREYKSIIDVYSQEVMVSAIELLLSYCDRFYGRQFITRKKLNTDFVSKFEQELINYFKQKQVVEDGLPSVEYFAQRLHLSASYLTDILRKETGKGTKEHIQLYVIELAKLQLLNSNDPISDIAYGLGFEYSQYFSRLFKEKTGMTPVEYRNAN